MPEYATVCQSMPEYARVCQSMPEYATFQVSHVYFMKYSMMGLLQMPNIMSSNRSRPSMFIQTILFIFFGIFCFYEEVSSSFDAAGGKNEANEKSSKHCLVHQAANMCVPM